MEMKFYILESKSDSKFKDMSITFFTKHNGELTLSSENPIATPLFNLARKLEFELNQISRLSQVIGKEMQRLQEQIGIDLYVSTHSTYRDLEKSVTAFNTAYESYIVLFDAALKSIEEK